MPILRRRGRSFDFVAWRTPLGVEGPSRDNSCNICDSGEVIFSAVPVKGPGPAHGKFTARFV